MGKLYFEFLEEEFMELARKLQPSASGRQHGEEDDKLPLCASKQLLRCQAIYQQMKNEVCGNAEFKERLGLYKIQLQVLKEYHQSPNSPKTASEVADVSSTNDSGPQSQANMNQERIDDGGREETTFQMWIENPRGRHLLSEVGRDTPK